MVTTRQTSRGRSAARSAGSRSASRSARSTSQRSRAPRGRAGHAGRGRGGRPRAASSRRDSGGGDDDPPGLVELREMVQDLHEQLEIRGGTVHQLQQELDDLRAQQAPVGPTEPADMTAEAGEPEVVISDMAPPAPRAPRSAAAQAQVRQFVMKETLKSWLNPDHSKRWLLTATKPVAVSLTRPAMRAMMYDTVEVTSAVHGMLNDLGSFDIREFMAPGDDRFATDRLLTEQLEIFIHAMSKLLSKGVSSSVGRARIAVLQQSFQSGLRMLRQHSVECRSEMRIRANVNLMANLINTDLNRWAARLYDEASDFTNRVGSPPSPDDFPPVLVPDWTRLSQYIQAGGLRNAQHQRTTPASTAGGRGTSATTTPSRKKKGYCFAWASDEGCSRSARDCRWEHAHDPNKKGRGKGSGRHDKRGGGSSGGGSSGDGSSGGGRRDTDDRGGGRGGGGSNGGGGSGSGGGGSNSSRT